MRSPAPIPAVPFHINQSGVAMLSFAPGLSSIQGVPVQPIDLTGMVAVVMGLMVVLIPVAGITARFALKPIAEAVARMREAQGSHRELELMAQRVALLEQQLSHVETDVRQLEEKTEFDRQLEGS